VWYAGQGLSATKADLYFVLRQVVGMNGEAHLTPLARAQVNPLESAPVPNGRLPASAASNVQLHDFIAVLGDFSCFG
jgi:hypothetical protein